jgi:dolichyl-phosphate-mannose--protein O-mannosyl transferase
MNFPGYLKNLATLRHSWIWLLVGVGLVYGLRLNRPEVGLLEDGKWLYSYDENYTVLTARRIAAGDPNVWDAWRHSDDHEDRVFTMRFRAWDLGNDDSRYEWVHPPTPRVLMAWIIRVAGMNAALYRLPSVAMGLLVVGMTWAIGNRMRGPGFALFAALLAASDGWLFCLARVGMTDIFLIGTTTAAYAAFYAWWTAERHRNAWMLLVGAACGAALSMKWSAAAPILGLSAMALVRFAIDWRTSPSTRRRTMTEVGVALVSFTVVPLAVYFASYWPFFAAGHSLGEWAQLHRAILNYNRTAPATAPGSSRWYQWPLDRGFTWFLTRAKNGACQYTFASSNWFVWWPFVPAIAYAAERFVEQRRFERGFLIAAAIAMWLPYALVHRFVFTRYFTMLVPVAALAVAMALFDFRERWPRFGGVLRAVYLAGALVFFVLRYPGWAGVPLPCRVTQGGQWDYWAHVMHVRS